MYIDVTYVGSITCLAALQRHGECLALVNKRLETEVNNPDLYIMRARLHEMFRNVSMVSMDGGISYYPCLFHAVNVKMPFTLSA